MQDSGLIVSNPKVMMGKPVIRGTRITVELVLEKFAAGQTEEQILRAHPHITREGIRAQRWRSRRRPCRHRLSIHWNA